MREDDDTRSLPGAGRGIELIRDADRPEAWWLLVDGITQSHVDLADPRYLELEYVQRLGHLIDVAAPSGAPLRVLHLGAGGLTLARYLAATRPCSEQVAVESDAKVAGLVRRRLPLDRPGASSGEGGISVRLGDARAVLGQLPAGSFGVVVVDVFAGAQTPAHVTSAEFTAAAARVLAERGCYAVNVADGPPLAHARGRVAAVRQVFRYVCVIAEPAVLRGRRFGNLVVVAAGQPLPVAELVRRAAADPFPARVLDGAALEEFAADAEPITDDRAQASPAMPPEVLT